VSAASLFGYALLPAESPLRRKIPLAILILDQVAMRPLHSLVSKIYSSAMRAMQQTCIRTRYNQQDGSL
jgi:hypothetical protein